EARLARHLHVEEEQVRLQVLEGPARLRGAGRFADDLDLRVAAQEAAELVARQPLVVHDQRLHVARGSFAGPAAEGTPAAGMKTSRVAPRGPDCRISRRARSPKASRRRSSEFARPMPRGSPLPASVPVFVTRTWRSSHTRRASMRTAPPSGSREMPC